MKEKSVLVLLAVFILLGGFYFFFSHRWQQADEAKALSDRVLPVESDAIQGFRLKNSQGTFEAEKRDNQWFLTHPVEDVADQSTISSLLSYLCSLSIQRSFEDVSDQEKKDYGLDSPGNVLQVDTKDTSYEIQLGHDALTKDRLYAMKNDDPRALVVESSIRERLNLNAYDLRNKNILEFDSLSVGQINYAKAGQELSVKKDDQGIWYLSHPEGSRADEAKVRSLLNHLRYGKVQAFVDDEPGNLESYGLADSATRISIFTEVLDENGNISTSASEDTLLLGKSATDEARIYAMQVGRDAIFELNSSFAQALDTEWLDLRDRNLFSIPTYECEKVEIKGATGVIFSASQEESGWALLAPPDRILSDSTMSSFLRDLSGLQIEAFLDHPESLSEYRLDPPDYAVTLKGDQKTETMQFGMIPPSATDEWSVKWVYAIRPDEDTVFAVDRLFVDLMKQDLKYSLLLPPSATEAIDPEPISLE